MTQPNLASQIAAGTARASTEDIKAIIAARAKVAADLKAQAARPPVFTTLSIPAAPASQPKPTLATPTAAPTPAAPPAVPAPEAPAVPPLAPADLNGYLTAFLDTYLPKLLRDSQPFAVATKALFQPPFSIGELGAAFSAARVLGDSLSELVSEAVAVGAPAVKGLDAEALVVALLQFLLHRYLAQFVPSWAYSMVESTIIGGLKMIYELKVRPRLKGVR